MLASIMAYDNELADRVRQALESRYIHFVEKKMMGGLCFMVADKMCLGIADDRLMVRLDPEAYDDAIRQHGCRPMDFTGRPMRGFVFVEPEGLLAENQFWRWIDLALEFNPKATSSKKAKPTRKRLPSAPHDHTPPRKKSRKR